MQWEKQSTMTDTIKTAIQQANEEPKNETGSDKLEIDIEKGTKLGSSTEITSVDSLNVVDKDEEETSPTKNSCCSDQMEKMKSTADWWSLWIGLASFLLAMILVFAVPYEKGSVRASNVVPGPMRGNQILWMLGMYTHWLDLFFYWYTSLVCISSLCVAWAS